MKKFISILSLIFLSAVLFAQHDYNDQDWNRQAKRLYDGDNLKTGVQKYQIYDQLEAEDAMNYYMSPNIIIHRGFQITIVDDSRSNMMPTEIVSTVKREVVTIDRGISVEQMIDAYNHPGMFRYQTSDEQEDQWHTGLFTFRWSKLATEFHTAYIYHADTKHVSWDKTMNRKVVLPESFNNKLDWWLIIAAPLALILLIMLELGFLMPGSDTKITVAVAIIILFIVILFNQWLLCLFLSLVYIFIKVPYYLFYEEKQRYKREKVRDSLIYKESRDKSVISIVADLKNVAKRLPFTRRKYANIYHLTRRQVEDIIAREERKKEGVVEK